MIELLVDPAVWAALFGVMAVTSVVLLPAALWWHRRMRPAARGARMG